jgi:hypothetical protein
MYAILVAQTVSLRPAGLALVEPPDERFLDLVAVQINETLDAMVSQGSITADTARQNAQGVRQAISEFRAGQPVNIAALLPSVVSTLTPILLSGVNARYVRTDDAVDVPAYAGKLHSGTRVLVTDGTADLHVPPTTIQPLMAEFGDDRNRFADTKARKNYAGTSPHNPRLGARRRWCWPARPATRGWATPLIA